MKPARTIPSLILGLSALVAISLPAADNATDPHVLTYSVADGAVTIVSAVTPYDADPAVREAFLHWFKRGFETALAGRPPLMIEWDITPAARAGWHGYDFGMEEAGQYMTKEPGPSPQTAAIPPA